ncbi:hypothetical protein CHS0354_034230 [Potamilus streckersoni]|uniref:DUF4211 domain-containing protein n=1 Tax=Potamilus streckersoni TaxID=2493646 RepID=A0AAE0W5V3_9BIVA|nr:hypothetical protein CHS0354_034230 [Potamilus streckersoni]
MDNRKESTENISRTRNKKGPKYVEEESDISDLDFNPAEQFSDDSLEDPDFAPGLKDSNANDDNVNSGKRVRGRQSGKFSKFVKLKPKQTSITKEKVTKKAGNKRKAPSTKSDAKKKKRRDPEKSSSSSAGESSPTSKPDVQPASSSSASSTDFQTGDFIVEKAALKTGKFVIWKVKNGGLIHKYDKVVENGNELYQNVMNYSNILKSHYPLYTRVLTRTMYKYRGEEKVQILEIPESQDGESSEDVATKKKSVTPIGTSTPKIEKNTLEISSTTSSSKQEFQQTGGFVIDKADQHNVDSFPVWKIENGRLLKKYEAFYRQGKILHRALKTFRGYKDIELQYLPIKVKIIHDLGPEEVIEVLEHHRPQLEVDEGLEEEIEKDPLMKTYTMVLQIFLSQALDSDFLKEIYNCEDTTYTEPLKMVEKVLEQKIVLIDKKQKWTENFKTALRTCPYLREIQKYKPEMHCDVCPHCDELVETVVYLFGRPYNSITLKEEENPRIKSESLEFNLGKTPALHVGRYHQMCHFRHSLYEKCQFKIKSVKEATGKTDVEEILDECLSNRPWVIQMFKEYKALLDSQ